MTGEAATVATANHDEAAAADRLGTLFDVHHQRLYRLARRMSRSAEEARDLVQDTFLRAVRAPDRCRRVPPPRKPGWCECWSICAATGGGRRPRVRGSIERRRCR
jgi:hypothetical protein